MSHPAQFLMSRPGEFLMSLRVFYNKGTDPLPPWRRSALGRR